MSSPLVVPVVKTYKAVVAPPSPYTTNFPPVVLLIEVLPSWAVKKNKEVYKIKD